MSLGGVLPQLFAEGRTVADQHRAHLNEPVVELRQGVQQAGKVLAVPEDTGLVLVQAAVLRQRLGVPGPQLAQGQIHEPSPCRRAVPDEKQILRREKHRVQHVRESGGVFAATPLTVIFRFLPRFSSIRVTKSRSRDRMRPSSTAPGASKLISSLSAWVRGDLPQER